MPHHRHARDDRHSMAPLSRFLDDAALDRVEVVDLTPPRPGADPAGAAARGTRVALPDLADLWA
jgi:DNA helicase-2/ATP-dependent DNA helicase PcrA